MDSISRCGWCGTDVLYTSYHDVEWGVPQHDDQKLFEMLVLDGAQAGLSWITILRKRDAYRRAFDQFDAERVARYDQTKIAELLTDASIVRNRLKIESAVQNARAYLAVREQFGTFDRYLWKFVDGKPIQHAFNTLSEIPATTPLSDKLSQDLRKRGFKFVGSTIIYAFMQAAGMVNDHLLSCFRYQEVAGLV
jgi:DNA-3-methyladenine glycosylase I